ncbi:MAG: hypothetical protein R3D29_00440 [Nitratireductor sp.]
MKTSTKYVIAGLAVVATAGAAFAAQGYRHHGDRARMAMEVFRQDSGWRQGHITRPK